jgi:hypothetical protein
MIRTAKVDKRVFFIEVVSLFDLRRSKCTVPAKVSKRVKSTPWAAGGRSRVRNTRARGQHRAQALRGRGEPREFKSRFFKGIVVGVPDALSGIGGSYMKAILSILAAGVLFTSLAAFGQNGTQPTQGQCQGQCQCQERGQCQGQGQGRGRGGAAKGDTNGDGICERTGKPVGEGRGPMNGRGRGMGGNCPNGAPQAPSK